MPQGNFSPSPYQQYPMNTKLQQQQNPQNFYQNTSSAAQAQFMAQNQAVAAQQSMNGHPGGMQRNFNGSMGPQHGGNPPVGAQMHPNTVNQTILNLQNCAASTKRLSFPLRKGVLIEPFRLEHNINEAKHTFQLPGMIYEELMWREDLELQLKSFHHEDKFMRVNWPTDIDVELNDVKSTIARSEGVWDSKPLYLKGNCHTGKNVLKISVNVCSCVFF